MSKPNINLNESDFKFLELGFNFPERFSSTPEFKSKFFSLMDVFQNDIVSNHATKSNLLMNYFEIFTTFCDHHFIKNKPKNNEYLIKLENTLNEIALSRNVEHFLFNVAEYEFNSNPSYNGHYSSILTFSNFAKDIKKDDTFHKLMLHKMLKDTASSIYTIKYCFKNENDFDLYFGILKEEAKYNPKLKEFMDEKFLEYVSNCLLGKEEFVNDKNNEYSSVLKFIPDNSISYNIDSFVRFCILYAELGEYNHYAKELLRILNFSHLRDGVIKKKIIRSKLSKSWGIFRQAEIIASNILDIENIQIIKSGKESEVKTINISDLDIESFYFIAPYIKYLKNINRREHPDILKYIFDNNFYQINGQFINITDDGKDMVKINYQI